MSVSRGKEREVDLDTLVETPRRRADKNRPLPARVREALRRAFVENAALKFVAFVLALTVFILVHSDENVYVTRTVSLQYRMPKDWVLVTEPPDQVRVTVKGTRRRTRRFDEADRRPITVDLTNHRRSEYIFTEDLINMPEGLTLERFEPPSIFTKFEPRVEKEVPVEVQFRGQLPTGYLVTGVVATPDHVTISGAESVVQTTTSVRTAGVSLEGKSQAFVEEQVTLVPGDAFLEVLEPERGGVKVSVSIVEEQVQREVGRLPVELRPGPDVSAESIKRFKTDPPEVQVWLRGKRLAAERVDARKLEAFVEIFADDVAVGRTRRARVVVPVPESGVAAEVRPAEVTIGVQ